MDIRQSQRLIPDKGETNIFKPMFVPRLFFEGVARASGKTQIESTYHLELGKYKWKSGVTKVAKFTMRGKDSEELKG